MELTLELTDDYAARNEMLSQLLRDATAWFELALSRAPVELHATLQVLLSHPKYCVDLITLGQTYLSSHQAMSATESSDLGPSVAFDFVKAFGPIDRGLGE